MDALAGWFAFAFARGLEYILSTTHPALAIVRWVVRAYLVLLAVLVVVLYVTLVFVLAVYLLSM